MSLDTNLQDFVTRASTEVKALRVLMTGGSGSTNLSGLTTTAKTSVVAAINELDAAIDSLSSGGSALALTDLTDVTISSAAAGHILFTLDGTTFTNGVASTTYGRALLELANQAGLMALIASASETVAGLVEKATDTEAATGTDNVRYITAAQLQAKMDALVDGSPGLLNTMNEIAAAINDDPDFYNTIMTAIAGKQPLNTNLTQIGSLTSAADKLPYATGAGTWAMTTLTSFIRGLLDDVDAPAARTTLDVWSKAEVGPVTTNYVELFETGLA